MTGDTANSNPVPLRKRQLASDTESSTGRQGAEGASRLLDVARLAQVSYTTEAPDHPIENLFDGSTGPNGSRWAAAEPDRRQRVEVVFDVPQQLSRIELEAAETEDERTQQVSLQVSRDGGQTFADLRRQEYTFSPGGATFQHEDWAVDLSGVTNLRVEVVPNKNGHGTASLVSLRLYR